MTFCAGYMRGLYFHGDYALVGLSKPRHNKTFSGLPLDDNLKSRKAEARCGIQVIDLRSGDVVHWLRIEGVVDEQVPPPDLGEDVEGLVLGSQALLTSPTAADSPAALRIRVMRPSAGATSIPPSSTPRPPGQPRSCALPSPRFPPR